MDKTVKELADAYGMSKQAISYHIKKLPKEYKNFDTKNGSKILYINDKGQDILRDILKDKLHEEVAKFGSEEVRELKQKIHHLELELELREASASERIAILEREIESHKAEKDRLITLNDQAQKLLMAYMQKTTELIEDRQKAQPNEEPKEPQKKWYHFWK